MKHASVTLALVALALPLHPACAQGWLPDRERVPADSVLHLRSPRTAIALGLVLPGAGQAYAGEWGRGYGYFSLTIGFAGLSVMGYAFNKCTFYFTPESPCSRGEERAVKAMGAGFAVATVATWTLSVIDAPRAARRENERRIAKRWRPAVPARTGVRPTIDVAPGGALLVGVALPLSR